MFRLYICRTVASLMPGTFLKMLWPSNGVCVVWAIQYRPDGPERRRRRFRVRGVREAIYIEEICPIYWWSTRPALRPVSP